MSEEAVVEKEELTEELEAETSEDLDQEEDQSVLDSEGSQVTEEESADWLPEDLRGNERFKGIESPEALARAYAEAKIAQELPDSYQLPQGAPEQLSAWAKENEFSQSQLDAMLGLQQKVFENSESARLNVYDQGRTELFKSWGEKKDENLKIAESVFQAIPSGPKLAQFIKATGEGKNPVIIQALQEIGSFLKEGGYLPTGMPKAETKKDPLRARYPTMFPKEEE